MVQSTYARPDNPVRCAAPATSSAMPDALRAPTPVLFLKSVAMPDPLDDVQSRSFPPNTIEAMREAYRQACLELRLGEAQTDQHRAVAAAILKFIGPGEIDQDALIKAGIAAGRKAERPAEDGEA